MFLLLVYLMVFGAQFAVSAAPAKNAAPTHVRPPVGASALSDAELERAIRQRFARSKAAADNFQVRVVGGVATIEGQTSVIQRKGAATRMARAAGARQVINKIVASQAARDKASANLTKGRRRVQVKRSEASERR